MTKFFLTLLIISLLVRFVLPVVLRLVVGMFIKKQVRRYGQQFGPASPFGGQNSPFGPPPGPAPAPGQVRVEYVPPQPKARKTDEFKGGDYVEYEEVK